MRPSVFLFWNDLFLNIYNSNVRVLLFTLQLNPVCLLLLFLSKFLVFNAVQIKFDSLIDLFSCGKERSSEDKTRLYVIDQL